MVEFIKLEKKATVLTDKQRTNLILFTYMSNFILYVILFDIYNNFLLKWLTFSLIIWFALQMLSRKISINGVNSWTFIYAIINGFAFGVVSMIFSYNLLLIAYNLLYFKHVLKRVNLNENT